MMRLPEAKRDQLERAIGAARILSGVLSLLLGLFLPSIGYGLVVLFGLVLIAYGVVTLRVDRTVGDDAAQRSWSIAITAGDAFFAFVALLLYSADPGWAIAPLIVPLIIVSAFRLGPLGAFGAAFTNTVGYLVTAAFRHGEFGYPVDWLALALLIVLSVMTATLVTAILVDAETLRSARRDLYEPMLAAQSRLGELIVVSEGGHAVYLSEAVPTFTGISEEQLKRQPLRSLFPQLAEQNGDREGHAVGSVRHFESELPRKGGATAHVEISVTDLPPLHGLQRSLIVARDITERIRARAELERLAIHDPLTGLPNRALVGDRLERVLGRVSENERIVVLYFDLDRFKDINDSLGHAGGDAVLIEVAARLQSAMTPRDSVSRYEGDEFVVVLWNAGDRAAERAAELLELLVAPFAVGGGVIHPTATVGVAIAPEHGRDAMDLIRSAETAMYKAKRASRTVGVYVAEDDRHGAQRIGLLNDLRGAIDRNELWLAFQPIVAMATAETCSVEVLLRWNHPVRGAIPPVEFIPLAEESGLIRRIGLWVLDQSMRTCASWPRGSPGISVNMSIRNLRMPELKDAISSTLEMWRLPRGALTLEITESIVMEDPDYMIDLLQELQEMGVRGSVDDYGTGYSSLAYLLRLPVREMKIDRAFVADMATNPQSEKIVRSTIDLAHDLGLLVVAEGIEDQATWDALAAMGCDLAQGYFIARPMPADDIRVWLREHRGRLAMPAVVAG